MAMFEIQGPDGRSYEVDAPNQGAALDAFRHLQREQERALALAQARRRRANAGQESLADGRLTAQQLAGIARGRAVAAARVQGVDVPLPADHTNMLLPGGAGQDAIDTVGAFSTGAIEGIPIAGPYLERGVRGAAALAASPFTDQPLSEIYGDMGRLREHAQAEHPYATTAGNVTGAVAGTVPMMVAAPGAFGMGAGSLGARTFASTLSGMGIGGTDAAIRSGGDPDATAQGAGMGLAAGALGPAVGQVLGAGARKAGDVLFAGRELAGTGITRRTASMLDRAAQADQLTPAVMEQRLAQLGPDAMVADLGPNLQQHAAALVALPGEGRGIVQGAMRSRDAGADRRILDALNANLGPAPVPSRLDAAIRDSQQALSPAYEGVFRNARRVDTQPIADALESQIVNLRGEAQTAARQVRQMLNVSGTDQLDPNPYTLFQTRRAIDGMMDGAQDGNVRRTLGSIRARVDDALSSSVPGLKDVDAQFAELARQREGLTLGQALLRRGENAVRPQELADELAAGAQPHGRMIGPSAAPVRMREGVRAELDRIVGTSANDRAKLQGLIAGEGDWNPQKLAQLFGEDRARRMLDVLDAERAFAETSGFVTRNSATAAREQGVRAMEGYADRGLGLGDVAALGGPTAVATKLTAKAADKIAGKVMKVRNQAVRADLARALTRPDSLEVIRALNGLTSRGSAEASSRQRIARALMFGPSLTLAPPVSGR